jgi:DHA2 family multidrug resistance protein-like MFS transporter
MQATSPPAIADEHDDGLPTPRRYFALGAVLAGMTLVVLDGAIANVALPSIATSLHVSAAASVSVVSLYQTALVIALLPCAALGESLGYRRVFVSGVVVFIAASALCAFSRSLPFLVAARFLQGLGGAALMGLAVALLRFTFPHRQLGTIIGINALVVALSGAAGPTIGATILSLASWPWLFAVNLPVGAVVLIAARALPRPPGTGRALDLASVAMHATSFVCLIAGANFVVQQPVRGGVLLAVSAVSFTLLIRREAHRPAPLIPLDLLRGASFRVSVIASVFCFAGQMASYVALPFYLQHGFGLSAFATGLYMTPWPLTVAVAAPLSGRLADRGVPTAWLCAGGGVLLAAGLALAALWRPHGTLLPLVFFLMICGVGFGLFQVPNNRNMLLAAPRARSGAAGGMQGTARLVGQTAGAVLMTLIFMLAAHGVAPQLGLGVAAGLCFSAGIVSLLRT